MSTSMSMFGRDAYGQIQTLRAELLSVRKSNQMKDDTIAFLQREKETLIREIRHYEVICSGIEHDTTLQRKYEQELITLRTDILHWKEVVKRHKQARKSTSREMATADYNQHKTLIDELTNNLNALLSDIPTENSMNIKNQLEEIISHVDHETSWHLLDVSNKALSEIQSQISKYKLILESTNRKPTMRYSHGYGEPIPHSQPPRSAVTRLAKQSIASMNGARRASTDSYHRTQSADSMPEFRTIPGFLPGLKKRLSE